MVSSERPANRYWNSDGVEKSQWDNLDKHEAEKRHELTDEQKKKIGGRLLDLMIKTELSYEEQSKILDALEKVYGVNENTEEAVESSVESTESTEETVESSIESTENVESAESSVESSVESTESTAESHEDLKDYEPMTLAKAEATGDSTIDIESVKETLKAKHEDVADVAISMLEYWNHSLTHEDRLNFLRGNVSENRAGMQRILTSVGLVEITANSNPDGSVEEEESTTDESESALESDEEIAKQRDERAREFRSNTSKWLWMLSKDPPINPNDLLNKPDEFTLERLDELDQEYENDRARLSEELMNNEEFSNWHKQLIEGMNEADIAEKGYDDPIFLKRLFETSKSDQSGQESTATFDNADVLDESDTEANPEEDSEEIGLDIDPLSADVLNDSETTSSDVIKFMDSALQKIKDLLGPDRIAKISSAVEKFKNIKGALNSWRALLTLPKEELSEANQDMLDTLEEYGILNPQIEESVEETAESTTEDDAEQAERPHITPITGFSIKNMSPNRMREHINNSFQKLEGSLSPDDASRLRDAVQAWNNDLSNSRRKGLLSRPLKKFGPKDIAVLQTLEEFGLVERIDTESVAAEDSTAEDVDASVESTTAMSAEEIVEESTEESAEVSTEESTPEGTTTQTAENNTEQQAERPRIRAITSSMVEGMRHVDISKQMKSSFKKLEKFLTPDEASRLQDAINAWNNLKDGQQKAFMKYPMEGFSEKNQNMIKTLEEFGLLERADTAARMAAEASAKETTEESTGETTEEVTEDDNAETTEDTNPDLSAERPRIRPVTADMARRMRNVDMNRHASDSLQRLKGFLSPDESSQLEKAVKAWTDLNDNQKRAFLTRPKTEFSQSNQDMVSTLEQFNLIQRQE
ncbi:hypothetical protein J5500_00420 [Candidatus Saccharibacteria bacterium]|nr:hypothetical protein [Candidatus Saccharibacteria bacterium]